MMTRTFRCAAAIIASVCASCAAPHDDARRPDTLFVGAAVPAITTDSPRAGGARPDSLSYTLHVFTGLTKSSGASPPEFGVIAPDGRQLGYDPLAKRYLAQIPNAFYDSSATVEDDDTAPGDSAPPAQAIDSRELQLYARAGETYTLQVIAENAGVYVLHVDVSARQGNGSVSKAIDDLKLGRREVRRFTVRIGAGTMELQPIPSGSPPR